VYHVNITANSLAAIAAEVFTQMMNKWQNEKNLFQEELG
jgi:post-segregation antitoxin (ccd killing protein)